MTKYTLKRRTFSLLDNGSGKSISEFKNEYKSLGGQDKLGKSFKEWFKGADSGLAATNKKIAEQEAKRAAQRAANIANPGAVAAKAGFKRGASSVGVLGGLKNTFAKAGTAGKIGMVGAGLAGLGLAAKGAKDVLD